MKDKFKMEIIDNYFHGSVELIPGTFVEAEVFLHAEESIESVLKTFGKYEKTYISDLYVSYICSR